MQANSKNMAEFIKKSTSCLLWSVMIVVLLSSCSDKGKKGKQADKVKTYPVTTLTLRNITLNADYPATLQGRQNVEIRPKIDGYLEAIYVDEGATVKKGQLLFKVSSPQYEEAVRNATAAISSAEVAVSSARLEVEKVKPLVNKDIISKYELETAELNLKSKEAEYLQAQANLANAKANLAYTRVTSPVDGVIGLIPYKMGSLVSGSSAQPLTTVSDIGSIYAYFSLNEKQLLEFSRKYPGITSNDKLKSIPPVSLLLSDGSEYSEKGKIEAISGLIDTNTGSGTMRATFSNPAGLIRSGGSAIVRIPEYLESVIVIPQSATFELQNVLFAFTVTADNKVKNVAVKTRATSDGQYYVVTEGLKAGDRVILEGVHLLKSGQVIIPQEADAARIYKY